MQYDQEMPTTKAAAEQLGCDEGSVIKTCIVKTKNAYSAVILQGTDRIDQKKLQAIIGKFSFANANEVQESTGYPAGGVPPFGFDGRIHEIVMDSRVFSHETVYGGGGTKETLVRISPGTIRAINEAAKILTRVEDFAK